jgi:hypothetical protein
MLFFADKFALPIAPLEKAYEQVLASNFCYTDHKQTRSSPDRKRRFCLQMRQNWDDVDYWIRVEQKASGQTQSYFVGSIPHFYAVEHPELYTLHISEWMNTHIRYIWPVGWFSNSIIELSSGVERLFFDVEKGQLIDAPSK